MENQPKDFISLHNHTYFSLTKALSKPIDLFNKVKSLGQSGVAITDSATLAAAWDSLKASKEAGVKLIIGCEFNFVEDLTDEKARMRHVILLAKNHQGYKNLLKAHKLANDNNLEIFKKLYPRINWQILQDHSEGLICLTGGGSGIISQLLNSRQKEKAKETTIKLKEIFGDNLALEVQPHAMKRNTNSYHDYEDQTFVNYQLIKFGEELNIKCVATSPSHYLEKEHAEAHDVMLCIGSGRPIKMQNRPRYELPEFYCKTRDEVKNHFSRMLGDEVKAEELCDNSLYFAGLCENPEWIDPKFSNPSGKELPTFPVKDQEDYEDFKKWLDQNEKYKDLDEDKAYLRHQCELAFVKMVPQDKIQIYRDRLEEELDVLYHCGVSSYMLIVADYLNWARKNGIPIGAGRGCLVGETLVLTENGYKQLKEIKTGEQVYTHTGKLQKVLNTFEFNVKDEKLLSLQTDFSFGKLIMTKNHKVFSSKDEFGAPSFIPVNKLKEKNRVFTTFPSRNNIDYCKEKIDLALFANVKAEITNDLIIESIPKSDNLSIRYISKKLNISRNFLQQIKRVNHKPENSTGKESYEKLSKYLSEDFNMSIDDWYNNKNKYEKNINRFVNFNEEWMYFLGRWTGDGWYISNNMSNFIGIAFNSNDLIGIERFTKFFNNLGFEISCYKHKEKQLVQMQVFGKTLVNYLKSIFVDYKSTSGSKHLPIFFRTLPDNLLRSLLVGLAHSDGSIDKNSAIRQNIDTTSYRMLNEIREALLYLGIVSSVNIREPWLVGKYLCNRSYKIRFNGLETVKNKRNNLEDGFYHKILDIKEIDDDKVYDITVENDHSYLTTNGVVHNSVGGSLVGWLLNIHEADPIKYNLIFSRFHNKLKDSYSDIDIDVSTSRRHLLVDYINKKYGEDCVAGVSNFNTLAPKVYARAIARVFEYGGNRQTAVQVGDAISALIPDQSKTFEHAVEAIPLLQEFTKKYPELIKYASQLGNKEINYSSHAAAKIINNRPLSNIVPVRKDKDGMLVVEYEKERCEANGLVKMDILGLSTLDIIDKTFDFIKVTHNEIPIIDPNIYDEKTYNLISAGDTLAVFQLGTSQTTINLCKQLLPKLLPDLSIITTVARPAAKEIREKFIETKNAGSLAKLIHPSLKRALVDAFPGTIGYALFDESLLILANDISNWDLHKADVLRKLTKDKGKHPEKVKKWKAEFIEDAIKNGIAKETVQKIWTDVVEPFGTYSFNCSHATLYSMISFQTAYLKAHYPLEFLTSNLHFEVGSNTPKAKDNIVRIKQEIRKHKVKIINPSINESTLSYSIVDQNTLLTGLDALKFIGKSAIPEIIAKRPFTSFEDFISRTEGRKIASPAILALAASGCLDSFGMTRKAIFYYAADYKKKYQLYLKRKNHSEPFVYPWPIETKEEWTPSEKFAMEKFYLGEGLSGNKKEIYPNFFNSTAVNFAQLAKAFPDSGEKDDKRFLSTIQAEVKEFFEFRVKKEDSKLVGQIMAKVSCEDVFGNPFQLTLFPKNLEHFKKRLKDISGNKLKLEPGLAIWVSGNAQWYEGNLSVIFEDLMKAMGEPQRPKDLKGKSVKMKIATARKKKGQLELFPTDDEILEDVEELLENEGIGEPDDEYVDNFIASDETMYPDIED